MSVANDAMAQEFEWDPDKAQGNLRKHKVPFLMACEVFKDIDRLERQDTAGNYDEERWIVLGRVDGKILTLVYTRRQQRIRIISARKATRNEQRTYWTGETSA